MLQELRERYQERSRRKFLDRCVDSGDQELRARVVAVVDEILGQAKTDGFMERWFTGHGEHDSTQWDFKPYGSAQRTVHDCGRRDHALYTEHRIFDAGPWIYTSDGDDVEFAVRFMPGGGFDTAEAFLEHVAANARIDQER